MRVRNKLVGSLILILLIFLSSFPTSLSEDNSDYPWWNDNWSYRQSIVLPINTSDEDTVYQPIDISFDFENNCWAEDETKHSIRVIYQYEGRFKELESQIYNLEYSDDDHVTSCGLVFLIPESANGEERYYVYYNEEETSGPDYPDRVKVEDSFFSYEPVKGILTETWTYNIMQGENIIYSVAKDGHIIGDKVCQKVVKLKEGAKSLLPNLGDHTASYTFSYWYQNDDKWKGLNTADNFVKSEISIDGNLMVKVGLITESEGGILRSTVFHKYYYSPNDEKGLYSNVKHEVLEPLPQGEYVEAYFASLINGMIKSSIIKELDYGEMPKYMHFYSEEERIKTHEFDPFPESLWEMIIGEEDDYDIGSFPWLSIDNGETGTAHGFILDDANIVSSGENERDGVQMVLYQSNSPNYPGLDGRTSYLYMGRNSYEPDLPLDNVIPDNYAVEFKSLYYTTYSGGYKKVEKEASLYQSVIDYEPKEEEEINSEEKTEEYNLTVYTHVPLNLILKKIGSNILLKNSYFHVELLYGDSVMGFEPSGKISLTQDYKIDWKNISLFRKATFSHQKPREYLIKVYLVEPIIGDEREFIGFAVVNLSNDVVVHIDCKTQGKINQSFTDQKENPIKEVETRVFYDNKIIHKATCNSQGESIIGLPVGFNEKYTLKSFYKGFLINDEEISLNLFNNFFPLKKTLKLDVYDLEVKIDNSSGNVPEFDIKMSLTSKNMKELFVIKPDRIENGVFHFENLIPSEYNLTIEYDSIKVTENVNISQDKKISVKLSDLIVSLTDLWGFKPENNETLVFVKNSDFDNPVTIYAKKVSTAEYKLSDLYPGNYSLFVTYRSTVLKQNINIPVSSNKIDIIFPVTFNITTNVFDTHGNYLENAKVAIIKEDEETSGLTSDEGSFVFTIPPGEYTIKVFNEDELIAQRKVDVFNDKTLTIVTSKEPLGPYLFIVFFLILLLGVGIYSYKNKKISLFLKFLSIALICIALIAPWWNITGKSTNPHLETFTNVYIVPNKMVTLTTNTDVIAGNIAVIQEVFTQIVDLILYLSIISVALVLINVLLKQFTKFKKLSLLTLFISAAITVGYTIVFYFAASMLSQGTVGSLFGTGKLNVAIYGDNVFEVLNCSWGLSTGFFLVLASSIILLILFSYEIKKMPKTIFILKFFKKGKKL